MMDRGPSDATAALTSRCRRLAHGAMNMSRDTKLMLLIVLLNVSFLSVDLVLYTVSRGGGACVHCVGVARAASCQCVA